jgi:hypothetical protein
MTCSGTWMRTVAIEADSAENAKKAAENGEGDAVDDDTEFDPVDRMPVEGVVGNPTPRQAASCCATRARPTHRSPASGGLPMSSPNTTTTPPVTISVGIWTWTTEEGLPDGDPALWGNGIEFLVSQDLDAAFLRQAALDLSKLANLVAKYAAQRQP